ncbi:MAG: PqqD family protein [Acidobacteriota bacterium]
MVDFRRCRDVRFRVVDREAVVLRQQAGETLVLNEVGARILEILDGGASLADTAERLASEFDVQIEQATRDAEVFADELVAAGILEEAAPDVAGPED